MAKFVIAPHMRLQEWVARDKGYFDREGLDYEFRDQLAPPPGGILHDLGNKVGAYQTFERGRDADVSCACHWTVNVAASAGHGKLYADAYSVRPRRSLSRRNPRSCIPPTLPGCRSRSATSRAATTRQSRRWNNTCRRTQLNLSFADGLLFRRMELLIDRQVPAAALFSGPYYFVEQLGFRKIIDTTFMMASMITGEPDEADIRKYFAALRAAQRDIDLRPERYTHYYAEEFPPRFREAMDTRRWGPGERIVFEPYSREMYDASFAWIAAHGIFPDGEMGAGRYEAAVMSLRE